MILHSNREGNDCIRKLRCHCIQIMHSDIYSVQKVITGTPISVHQLSIFTGFLPRPSTNGFSGLACLSIVSFKWWYSSQSITSLQASVHEDRNTEFQAENSQRLCWWRRYVALKVHQIVVFTLFQTFLKDDWQRLVSSMPFQFPFHLPAIS